MSVVVELEWTFSPSSYFEEALEILRYDYAMIIADGKVGAKIEPAIYDANPAMRQLNTQSFDCFRLTVGSDIPLNNDGK